MTRAELRSRVRFFIDEPTQQNYTDADINTALNVAQDEVQLEIIETFQDYFISPTPTVINLIAGTETYALATDVVAIKRVEDAATGLEILPLDLNEKVATGTGLPGLLSATPGNWYLVGNYIGFTPPPSMNNTVNYWYVATLPDLTNDTDVSQIPALHHDILAVRAAIDCLVKDESDVTQLTAIYSRDLDRLKRTLRSRQTQAPKRVRRTTKNDGWPAVGPF